MDFPRYPPRWAVRLFSSLREFFLRLNRRFTHPNVVLWEMVHQFWFAAGLGVVAELGIADLLKDGPRTIGELAARSGAHEESLYRVMRMLASRGVFRERGKGVFVMTRLAEPLREDRIRYLLLLHLTPGNFSRFADLLEIVQNGSRKDMRPGQALFDHISGDVERNRRFTMAMTNATWMQVPAVLDAYPFAQYRKLIDLGGGQGLFLAALLHRYPNSHGLVFDLPGAMEGSGQFIEEHPLKDRLEFMKGDFFEEVPGGGDLYILKSVLHDWNDEEALIILRNVRRAMTGQARLLVIETLLDEGNRPSYGKMTDILMMVTTGGRERTGPAYESLLGKAGFRILKIYPTITPHSLIEAAKLAD